LGLLGSPLLLWAAYRKEFHGLTSYGVILGALLTAQICSRAWHYFFSYRAEDQPTRRQKAEALAFVILFSLASSFVGWEALHVGFQRYEQAIQQALSKARELPIPVFDATLETTEQALDQYETYRDKKLAEAIVFGPAVLIGVLYLVILLQIGLMGHNLPDNRREWWSRLGATLLLAFGSWTALSYCALNGPQDVLRLKGNQAILWLVVTSWLGITTIGFRWGFRAQTPPVPMESERRSAKRFEWLTRTAPREWIARIAPYFYIAGLAMLLSFLLYVLTPRHGTSDYWSWLLPLAMLVLSMLLAWRLDINEFSMHHFYRNRLVRCYLGASREYGTRRPNPFTGFDPEDDFSLSVLRAKQYHGPFPIFNTALNLVAGKELAWQERKAASFVFTPLYCGYELAPGAEHGKPNFANYGYRPTMDYAEPRSNGPTLGTAFAISGAAVNPNMGYHSSPAVSFLMALFNVRLGCWLGNTRHRKSWEKSSPKTGLTYLIDELIGNTDDTSWFINLSDGGHFENLGVYELVRRRCKRIIVSDAEEDSSFSFNGLGNAIRKCRTDFGVDIKLNPDQLRPVPGMGKSRTHCAVGEIVYSPEMRGKLLYIKTSLTGDEPGDVLEYKLNHSVFPHQSTGDQFFDESQFESYRALGQHTAMVILKRASEPSSEEVSERPNGRVRNYNSSVVLNEKLLSKMFEYLQAMWYPPTPNMVTLGERHSRLYADLVEKFRSSRGNDLDAAARIFFRTSSHPEPEFLVYSLMIELMHRVFQDLELETMADHPHNEGWVSMFHDWAEDSRFQSAWNVVKGNYDVRFRNFCQKEFKLNPNEPPKKVPA
jgi:hypothetical protein